MTFRFRDSVATFLDAALALAKWPIALFALAVTVPLGYAWVRLAGRLLFSYWTLLGLIGGIALYWFGWRPLSKRIGVSRWFLAVEHELTHALFALLTFHRIHAIHASWDGQGRVEFDGRGNWLIAISPYFFPTAPLLLLFLVAFFPTPFLPMSAAALGFALTYHIRSTWAETHSRQSDLRRTGLLFSCLFLPAANLLSLGFLLSCMVDQTPNAFFGDAAGVVQRLLGDLRTASWYRF